MNSHRMEYPYGERTIYNERAWRVRGSLGYILGRRLVAGRIKKQRNGIEFRTRVQYLTEGYAVRGTRAVYVAFRGVRRRTDRFYVRWDQAGRRVIQRLWVLGPSCVLSYQAHGRTRYTHRPAYRLEVSK